MYTIVYNRVMSGKQGFVRLTPETNMMLNTAVQKTGMAKQSLANLAIQEGLGSEAIRALIDAAVEAQKGVVTGQK